MKTLKLSLNPLRFRCAIAVMAVLLQIPAAFAANIVWVSHNGPLGFSGAVAGVADDGIITNLLQTAGHNVIRFYPANDQNTALTAAQLEALNTNDLVIFSRSINSPAFQTPGEQTPQWNTAVTAPLMMLSPYLVRPDGGRMGWFTGGTLPDTAPPTYLEAVDLNNPNTAYLFQDVTMEGNLTTESYDEAIDRNTSTIVQGPVPGGTTLARATFVPLAGGAEVTANIITEFPAGTAVRGGADILSGYRMFVAAGSREVSGVNTAGKENLTPAGESIFLRAVELAVNEGVPPNIEVDPILIATDPESQTVSEGGAATLSVTLSQGTQPRYQWYLNDAPVPSATGSSLAINPVGTDAAGDYFVVITNRAGSVTSLVATLTVIADTVAPTILSARAPTMSEVDVIFSEPLLQSTAEFADNFFVEPLDSSDAFFPLEATLVTPTTVTLLFPFPLDEGLEYRVVVNEVRDRSAAANVIEPNSGREIRLPGYATGNIVFVSDNSLSPGNGFSEAIAGFEDDAFVTNFLQWAGYNVIRFNPDNAAATLLTLEEIEALNTNDLIIISRSMGSGAFLAGQGSQWNTNITAPMIVLSSYLVRSNNLSWFIGSSVPDDIQTALMTTNLLDPETAYLFQDVAMSGNTTIDPYDFPLDRNTSMITGPTVPGGVVIATAVHVQNGATAIAEFPAGTAVRGDTEILAGYRMFFAGGSREADTVPNAGKNNLTPTGEAIFLRAVELALRNGSLVSGTAPVIINPQLVDGSFSAAFQTENGVTYQVEYKEDLTATTWTLLTTINGDGTVQTFTDAAPAASSRFYRVVIP